MLQHLLCYASCNVCAPTKQTSVKTQLRQGNTAHNKHKVWKGSGDQPTAPHGSSNPLIFFTPGSMDSSRCSKGLRSDGLEITDRTQNCFMLMRSRQEEAASQATASHSSLVAPPALLARKATIPLLDHSCTFRREMIIFYCLQP